MRRMFAFLSALCLLGSTAHGAEVVKVNMKDGDLGFKDITVKGEARFEVENSGTTEHGFELEGEIGGKKFEVASPVLAPGGKATFIVELPAGTYEAYCPVDDHRAKGMEAKVTFAGE